MRGLPTAHFLAGSCQTRRASHRHSSQLFLCSKLLMNLMLSTSLAHSGAVCPGFLLANSSPPVFRCDSLCYWFFPKWFRASWASLLYCSTILSQLFLFPPSGLHRLLPSLLYLPPTHLMPVIAPFSLSQRQCSHHLPVLPLYSKKDFLASSWPFVLLNLWHIFLPYCHLCSSMVCCLILTSAFVLLLLLLHIFTHFQKSPTVSGCPPWHRPLQLMQPHFYAGLSSSPSHCLLTYLRKSSWRIRFLFPCSVHFKLSLHPPVHHMWVIFSSNLASLSQKPFAVLLEQLLKHFYYEDFPCSLQCSFFFQLDVSDVRRLNLLVKSWGMFLTCSRFIYFLVY